MTCNWCQRSGVEELHEVIIEKPRAATYHGKKILKGGKTLKVCLTCKTKLAPSDV